MQAALRTGSAMPGPVRFLSDLHLGHDMCSLNHTRELWPLIEGAGTVVFNGDTTEEGAECFRTRSLDMFAELVEMCRRAGAEMVMLNGNHDPECWPHDWLDLADGGMFVTHGHVLLRHISPWSRKLRYCRGELEQIHAEYTPAELAEMETRFTIARRCCLAMPPSETRQKDRSLAATAALLLREIWPPTRPLEVLKVWARLPSLAGGFLREFRPEARVMLFGHTHRAAVWRRNGRLLVNSGGFVTFARPLISELDNGRFSVFRINQGNGELRRGKAVVSETVSGRQPGAGEPSSAATAGPPRQ